MLIYYAFYAIMIIVAALCFKTQTFKSQEKAKRFFCIVGFVCLALIMSLRHPSSGLDIIGLGGENIGYIGTFKQIAKLSWSKALTFKVLNYEQGYTILAKFLSMISKDSQILLVGCGIIQSASLFFLIYKTSKKPLLSTIIYLALPCFFIYWSGLRQGIAISITMLAFLMIKEKKLIKFILLVILAWLFHASAIVFLIAYPLYHLKMSSIWKLVSVITIPLVYIFREPLFEMFSVIFKEDAKIGDTGASTLFLVFVLIYVFLIFFGNSKNKQLNGCANLFWVACLVQTFSGIYDTAMRVGYYFMVYAIISIPEVVSNDEKNNTLSYQYKTLISMLLFLAFISYGVFTIHGAQGDSWFTTNPYRFFWQ